MLTSPHTEGEAWGGCIHHQPTHNHNLLSAAKHYPQEVKLSRGGLAGLAQAVGQVQQGEVKPTPLVSPFKANLPCTAVNSSPFPLMASLLLHRPTPGLPFSVG